MLARAAVLSVSALLALASPAAAQQSVTVFGLGPGLSAATYVDAAITGSLAIAFHGDQAGGCAARGVCGYNGAVVWRPGGGYSSGSLVIGKLHRHGRGSYIASLFIFGQTGAPYPAVAAQVRRDVAGQSPGTCADAASPDSTSTLVVHAGVITLRVLGAGTDVLSTRCAGPLDGDLASFLPAPALALKAALRGHRRVDLRGTRSFAAGGFAGTVRSTLVLQLGAVQPSVSGALPVGIKTQRERVVTESLSLVDLAGGVSADVRGAADVDVCALLDSCGLAGTISLQPRPGGSQGELVAVGPARRPYRDFLAALGLSRRGRRAGIQVTGDIGWEGGGAIAEDLNQATSCRDSAPLGAGDIVLGLGRLRVNARYAVTGAPRTRCPGPLLGSRSGALAAGASLASGSIPRRSLAQKEFSIVLQGTGSFSDDGYVGRLGGKLSLRVRRGAVTQRIFTQPTG